MWLLNKAYDHNKDLEKIKGTDQGHRPRNVDQTSKMNIARRVDYECLVLLSNEEIHLGI